MQRPIEYQNLIKTGALEEVALVIKAHTRRNETTYHSPFPPVSKAEADALVGILKKYIPEAHRLSGTPLTAP